MPWWVVFIIVTISFLLISFNLYLFLIAPSDKRRREVERYRGTYFAHRGLHGGTVAENSERAFELACQKGYGIELDVRLSSDGVPLIFHDDVIEYNGEKVAVDSLDLATLRTIPIGEGADRIPTLDEALALIDGRVPLLLEIKEKDADASVAKAILDRLAEYKGELIVESFEPRALRCVRRALPHIPLGILCCRYWRDPARRRFKLLIAEYFLTDFLFRPDFVAYQHTEVGGAPLFFLRGVFDPPLFAWTVRSAEEERTARESGFEYIIFEGYEPSLSENNDEI